MKSQTESSLERWTRLDKACLWSLSPNAWQNDYIVLRDEMTKKNLKTCNTSNATIEMNAGGKLVSQISSLGERGLLQRPIVISRSRPQLDLTEYIATYEFGVVPWSLFASDGRVLFALRQSENTPPSWALSQPCIFQPWKRPRVLPLTIKTVKTWAHQRLRMLQT